MTLLGILWSLTAGTLGALTNVFMIHLFGYTSRPARIFMFIGGACVNVLFAAESLDRPGAVISNGASAGILAWLAWREWRRGRQGRPSRLLGRVRNLGHRLVVTPEPVPAA